MLCFWCLKSFLSSFSVERLFTTDGTMFNHWQNRLANDFAIVETSPEFLCIRTLFRLMAYISSSCIREEGSPNSQNNFNNYQGRLFCSHVKWIDDKLIELSLSLIHTQKLFLSHFTKFISYQPFRLFPTESEPKITQTLCSRHISGLIKDLCTVLLLITNVRALQIECSRESKAHGILKINIF